MAVDKKVRRMRSPRSILGANRRTKKGRKRNTWESFRIRNGAA